MIQPALHRNDPLVRARIDRKPEQARVSSSGRTGGRYFDVTAPPMRSARLIDASLSLAVNCVSVDVLYVG